jgi:hypothetical protein
MKRGGSKMGYAEQFNLLSPCYKDGEQRASDFRIGGAKAKATKKGKPTKKTAKAKSSTTKKAIKAKSSMTKKAKSSRQKGGSSCYASPSVAEMGVHDKPASLEPTASERAWDNRMKGGDSTVAVAVKPNTNTNNLFSINPPPVVNSTPVNSTPVNSTPVNSTPVNSTPVNSKNNSQLNKIKNELLPTEIDSGLVMKLIKTSKNSINSTNPTNPTYSFEIFYKSKKNNEIQKSSQSNVGFKSFLDNYLKISEEVFPRPPKGNSQAQAQANTTTKAATNTTNPATVGVPNAVVNQFITGGRKRKNNHK